MSDQCNPLIAEAVRQIPESAICKYLNKSHSWSSGSHYAADTRSRSKGTHEDAMPVALLPRRGRTTRVSSMAFLPAYLLVAGRFAELLLELAPLADGDVEPVVPELEWLAFIASKTDMP